MLLRLLPLFLFAVLLGFPCLALRGEPSDGSAAPRVSEPQLSDDLPAPREGAGHGVLAFGLGFYHNDDNDDGNPFLDEELTVVEPVIVFDYNVTDRLSVSGKLSYDLVSSASIDRLSEFPEQSGASGDTYLGGEIGARFKLTDTLRVGGGLSGSSEYDYNSIGGNAFVAKDVADRNATLKLSLNGFFDQVDVIRFDGSEEDEDDRVSVASTFSWYQILDRRTHAELGYTASLQSGFLETPYNAAVIEDPALAPNPNLENNARGREITEELPNSRFRNAVTGRVRRALEGGRSVELGSRLYADTWGIYSLALEPRLYQWLVEDRFSMRVRYRFYVQTAADDFDDHFREEKSHRTQDSDLGDFDSHSLGLRFDWYVTPDLRLNIGGDYILRSDGIDQILGEFGASWSF